MGASRHGSNLDDFAMLAGWATPKAKTGKYQYSKGNHGKPALNLEGQADLTSWATPAARDWRSDRGRKTDQQQYGTRGQPLPRQALLTDSGTMQNGSGAGTGSTGQLNPAFSRWLMGLPAAWDDCAPMATRCARRKP
jgi:hypothetical protein